MTDKEKELQAETIDYYRRRIADLEDKLANADYQLEGRDNEIAKLEKENAELKKRNLDTQDAVTMQMYTNIANKEIANRQLTKAKELLTRFVMASVYFNGKEIDLVEEAEQFLNSEV